MLWSGRKAVSSEHWLSPLRFAFWCFWPPYRIIGQFHETLFPKATNTSEVRHGNLERFGRVKRNAFVSTRRGIIQNRVNAIRRQKIINVRISLTKIGSKHWSTSGTTTHWSRSLELPYNIANTPHEITYLRYYEDSGLNMPILKLYCVQ